MFSIVTVCRNEASRIEKTLRSVAGQTSADFELIVIDGGSTDGTLEKLHEHEDLISALVSEPDTGIYNAMNKGVARCKGDYVLFLNAGDYFASDEVLDKARRLLAEHRPGVGFGDLIIELSAAGSSAPQRRHHSLGDRVIDRTFFLKSWTIPHQASFVRLGLFREHGGFDERYRIAADYDFFLRILLQGGGTVFRHLPLTVCVYDGSGVSSIPSARRAIYLEHALIKRRHFGYDPRIALYDWTNVNLKSLKRRANTVLEKLEPWPRIKKRLRAFVLKKHLR